MPDKKGNYYLYEALELRTKIEHETGMLNGILRPVRNDNSYNGRTAGEEITLAEDFDSKEIGVRLTKLTKKYTKLNQAIQLANLTVTVRFKDEEITLAEVLELRKQMETRRNDLYELYRESIYIKTIHKEERDIVVKPKDDHIELDHEYIELLDDIYRLHVLIHDTNHKTTVKFREE